MVQSQTAPYELTEDLNRRRANRKFLHFDLFYKYFPAISYLMVDMIQEYNPKVKQRVTTAPAPTTQPKMLLKTAFSIFSVRSLLNIASEMKQ